MNVVILGDSFIGWGGGIDFLKSFINALQLDESINLMFFMPKYTFKERVKKLVRCSIRRDKISLREILSSKRIEMENVFLSEFENLNIIYYENDNINELLVNKKVDIVFPTLKTDLINREIPHIGYIYDFQHKYLKELFAPEERARRDEEFIRMVNSNKALFVNAKDVKKDINKFFPDNDLCVYVPPFLPIPRDEWLKNNMHVLSKYNLPDKYFLISNQFWVHKNHLLTFHALKDLHDRYNLKDVHFVYTGKVYDYRDEDYYNKIINTVDGLKISDYVHFVGYIPKIDQIEMLKKSIAVIQPTLFEGGPGGGVAYDAIAMGKRIILSNIPVNCEIEDELAEFFESNSISSLTDMCYKVYTGVEKKISTHELKKRGGDRREVLCKFLVNMFNDTIKEWNKNET